MEAESGNDNLAYTDRLMVDLTKLHLNFKHRHSDVQTLLLVLNPLYKQLSIHFIFYQN
jgi:hypothetical protein